MTTKEIKHQICGDGFIQHHPVKTPAQPEQEPVAWVHAGALEAMINSGEGYAHIYPSKQVGASTPLYTTPPQRTWVGLTDAEFQMIYDMGRTPAGMMEMVEAKLKEKNT